MYKYLRCTPYFSHRCLWSVDLTECMRLVVSSEMKALISLIIQSSPPVNSTWHTQITTTWWTSRRNYSQVNECTFSQKIGKGFLVVCSQGFNSSTVKQHVLCHVWQSGGLFLYCPTGGETFIVLFFALSSKEKYFRCYLSLNVTFIFWKRLLVSQ